MCVCHVPQKTVHLKLRLVKFNHVLLGKSRGQFGMSCIITYWSIQWGPPLYQPTNGKMNLFDYFAGICSGGFQPL